MATGRKAAWVGRFLVWEHAVVEFANRLHHRQALSRFFALVSRLGDGVGWYALMAALFVVQGVKTVPALSQMLVTAATGVVIYAGLKRKTARPRPCDTSDRLQISVAPLDKYSFPSGHTLHAVTFAILFAHHFPGTVWLVVPFAALVMMSRLVLGLHYLTDVLAGAVIGALLALAALYLGGLVAV